MLQAPTLVPVSLTVLLPLSMPFSPNPNPKLESYVGILRNAVLYIRDYRLYNLAITERFPPQL